MRKLRKGFQCGGCLQYFGSIEALAAHREGESGDLGRCLTTAEMKSRGWVVRDGWWLVRPVAERAKA